MAASSHEGPAVSYKSILVNIDIDAFPNSTTKLAIDLARQFDARLIGVCAAEVPPPVVSPDGMILDVELLEAEVGIADVLDVHQRPGFEVVDADDPVAAAQELVAHVRPQEPGATGDKTGGHGCEG